MKSFRHLLIKLTSRKFIIAIIPTIAALMAMFGIDMDSTTTFASAFVAVSAIVSYIATEGAIDIKGLKKKLEEYEDIIFNVNLIKAGIDSNITDINNKISEIGNRMALQSTTLRDVSEVANIAYASIPEEQEELVDTNNDTETDEEQPSIDIDSLPLQESFDDGLTDDNDVVEETTSELEENLKNLQENILNRCNDETIDIMKDIISKYEESHKSKE